MTIKDVVKAWESKVDEAVKGHGEFCDQFRVKLARAFFEGQQKPEYATEGEWITLNMVYSHMLAQLPTLYSLDPYFYIKLTKTYNPDPDAIAEFERRGQARQANLNYLKVELNLKSKARLCIQDAHFSYGVMKTYYIADLKKNEEAGEPIVDEKGNELKDETGAPLVKPDVIPVNERYEITRVHPDDLIWGSDSGTLPEKWNWIGERLKMTLKAARKDARFNKSAIKQIGLKQNKNNKDPHRDTEENIIELWEIYDLMTNEFFIWSRDADQMVMNAQKVPLGVEKHPYHILRFTLRDNSPYPIPPMSQGLDSQKEYNEARSKVMIHRKRFNRKYEMNVNGVEDPDVELAKLEAGEDGTVIRKMISDKVVSPISDAPLDQQSYTEIGMLRQDMAELMGATDNARGIANADSATEADILNQKSNIKEGDRLSQVVDWLADIGGGLDKLIQVHIDQDQAVKIEGPEGELWRVVKEDDYQEIEGEFQYSVNVGSTQPKLPHIERSQWIAFMSQVVIPMPNILTKPGLMKKMAQMFGIEDDSMLKEFQALGQEIVQQQGAGVNPQGSAAGVTEDNPVAKQGGTAGGFMGGTSGGIQ